MHRFNIEITKRNLNKKKKKMKKLIYVFIATMTLGVMSCGNKTASTEAIDEDSVMVDTAEVVDSIPVDSICLD